MTNRDERASLQAIAEWPPTEEMAFAPKYVPGEAFSSYVRRLNAYAIGEELPEG